MKYLKTFELIEAVVRAGSIRKVAEDTNLTASALNRRIQKFDQAFDGLIFKLISEVAPWFFFMPALGNVVMARLAPNPPLACALAVMMHALFGVSLGLGFSLFFSCARCMMRELIIYVGRVVRWRVTRLAPCYLSIRNPHAH